MGLPADLVFRTKGQLAIGLCADGFADGVWFDFVCGDEVYGNSTELREFCEDRGQGYVLRVRSTFHLVLAGGGEAVTCAQAARALGKNTRRWEIRSARAGSKGHRRYACASLCAAPAALRRGGADTQAPARFRPVPRPPADPGMIPLTAPEIKRLLAPPASPARTGHAEHWANWRRRHQALARWYHQRTRIARDTKIVLVT